MKKGTQHKRHVAADQKTVRTIVNLIRSWAPPAKLAKLCLLNCRKAVDFTKARTITADGHVEAFSTNHRALRYFRFKSEKITLRLKRDFSPVLTTDFLV